MKIYIESLYNNTGEWIDLTDIDEDELEELVDKYSLNGMHDIIIADWEDIPFRINMYSDWMKVWNKVQYIENNPITEGHINIIEQLGYDFLNMDEYDIRQITNEIHIISADSDEEFAEEYYEGLYNLDDMLPSIFRDAIDWSKVYRELEIGMTLTTYDGEYYYIFN